MSVDRKVKIHYPICFIDIDAYGHIDKNKQAVQQPLDYPGSIIIMVY